MRLFRGQACVLMPSFVEELVRTIGQIAPRHRGDGVNNLPKFGLGLLHLVERISKSFLGSFPVLNVSRRRVPSNDFASVVQQWVVLDQVPAVFPIFPEGPLLIFERNTAEYRVPALINESLDIIWMKNARPEIDRLDLH